MIFHENRLLVDDSHEIAYLIFSEIRKDVAKCVVLELAVKVIKPSLTSPEHI